MIYLTIGMERRLPGPSMLSNTVQNRRAGTAAKKEMEFLAVQSVDKTVTLLCKERENDPHCHRHILKKIIYLKAK